MNTHYSLPTPYNDRPIKVFGDQDTIDLRNGLIAYYNFNDNLDDSSSNNYHLTADTTVSYDAGILGSALSEGTSRKTGLLVDITNGLSVSLWFGFSSTTVTTSVDIVGAIQVSAIPSRQIKVTVNGSIIYTSDTLSIGFNHVVVTHDDTVVKIYINNVEVHSENSNIIADSFDEIVSTGAVTNFLDELFISGRALNINEVNALYNEGIGYDPITVISFSFKFNFAYNSSYITLL